MTGTPARDKSDQDDSRWVEEVLESNDVIKANMASGSGLGLRDTPFIRPFSFGSSDSYAILTSGALP